jgi:hypothetical protein
MKACASDCGSDATSGPTGEVCPSNCGSDATSGPTGEVRL